jgi:hypothetical protein
MINIRQILTCFLLLGIYQRLSPKLHFNAANFQAYVKAKEGTNFILLHFVRITISID